MDVPKRIFLQTGGDNCFGNEIDDLEFDSSPTWCTEKINDDDAEYIRYDKYAHLQAENARQRKLIDDVRDIMDDANDSHGMKGYRIKMRLTQFAFEEAALANKTEVDK